MDVVRSFPQRENFDHKALTRILRSIAFSYSDTASYCQGMNYLAGIFQLNYKEEKICFQLLS